jgi:hypothetical protein
VVAEAVAEAVAEEGWADHTPQDLEEIVYVLIVEIECPIRQEFLVIIKHAQSVALKWLELNLYTTKKRNYYYCE